MNTINFVDEFGVPHCVEVESITKEEYDRFGGTEITLSTEHTLEDYSQQQPYYIERGKQMLKLNPGLIYDHTNHPYILSSGGLAMNVSQETERTLHTWSYNDVALYIESKASIIFERAHQLSHEKEAHEDHSCGCGCNHSHENKGYFGDLIEKHTGTGGDIKTVSSDPVADNKIRKPKAKPYSGIFGRYVNGDAPSPFKEMVAPEHHQSFTDSLKYAIDNQTGKVYVYHTMTGTTDLADAGEIDVLYRHCPQFKEEYDNMLKQNVGRTVYTGNPIQDAMNMGGFRF